MSERGTVKLYTRDQMMSYVTRCLLDYTYWMMPRVPAETVRAVADTWEPPCLPMHHSVVEVEDV